MSRVLTKSELDRVSGLPSRSAAKYLGVGKSTINKYRALYHTLPDDEDANPRILTIDIESKPLTVYTWGLFNQNIGINQIKENGGMICVAYKWLGEATTGFLSDFHDGHEKMVREVHKLLSEADIVITYNGDRYDFKRLNNEFLELRMGPPKPYKSIDLIKTNRAQFDLPSRKLDYLAQFVGEGEKNKHSGMDLWVRCFEQNDPDAWEEMREYNLQDVKLTERLYTRLLPWLKHVPHAAMFAGGGTLCPYCGSKALVRDGEYHTLNQTYALYCCDTCEGWSRGTQRLADSVKTREAR